MESCSSEIGAGLGARMIAHKLVETFAKEPCRLETPEGVERTLEEIRRGVLGELRRSGRGMADKDSKQVICDCFLFTVVGCVVGACYAAFFSIGDGVIVVNGEATIIGPFADKAPPYLAYGLLSAFKDQRICHSVLAQAYVCRGVEEFSDRVGWGCATCWNWAGRIYREERYCW